MHHKQLCLKHRMLDCKCNSPLSIGIGYRDRIPPKDKINRWKEFINDYLSDHCFTTYTREQVIKSWK